MAKRLLGIIVTCQFLFLLLTDFLDVYSSSLYWNIAIVTEIVLVTVFLFFCAIAFICNLLVVDFKVSTILATFSLLTLEIFALIFLYAAIYSDCGIQNSDKAPVNDFADCLYFSMMTWTTVGYGDLVPVGKSRIFAMCEAFSQYVVMALLVAAFISLAQSMREQAQNRRAVPSE